jgi:frataxin-like iron-binding protein CyaY
MEKQVLTQEEINQIKDLKVQFSQITDAVGEVEIQKMNLEIKRENLKQILINLQEQEIKLAQELEQKYGQGTISLETGEFIPNK